MLGLGCGLLKLAVRAVLVAAAGAGKTADSTLTTADSTAQTADAA